MSRSLLILCIGIFSAQAMELPNKSKRSVLQKFQQPVEPLMLMSSKWHSSKEECHETVAAVKIPSVADAISDEKLYATDGAKKAVTYDLATIKSGEGLLSIACENSEQNNYRVTVRNREIHLCDYKGAITKILCMKCNPIDPAFLSKNRVIFHSKMNVYEWDLENVSQIIQLKNSLRIIHRIELGPHAIEKPKR